MRKEHYPCQTSPDFMGSRPQVLVVHRKRLTAWRRNIYAEVAKGSQNVRPVQYHKCASVFPKSFD